MTSVRTGGAAVGGPVEPGAAAAVALRPLGGEEVELSGGFWGQRQLLNREVTIPHGIAMLEERGNIENLRAAAGQAKGEYHEPKFMDSDVYKVLEAVAWERRRGREPDQERFFSTTAGLLAAAQMPDGYLNSYFQVAEPEGRFRDPAMGHELYCAGHLMQAAVAEARSVPKVGGPLERGLLGPVAGRLARCVATAMRDRPGFVPGHPEVEMALVEMYRLSGTRRWLGLAKQLVGRRGRGRLEWGSFGPDYFQDDIELEKAQEVRGHAVRALYLLCGATDLYMETGRKELLASCLAQWDDMVAAKTYLTGGVGARHEGEAFGAAFELPAEGAYCETCAAVASIMWNWRMLLATGEARFAELLERTLYNGFLAGWGLDGRSFFYVNPLRSRGGAGRQPWYRCACCPPNVMRLVASLQHYVATRTAEGLQLHQLMACSFRLALAGGSLAGRVETAYPYEGELRVVLDDAPPAPTDLALRVPSWAKDVQARANGRPVPAEPAADGYLHVRRQWQPGDELALSFGLSVRVTRADPRIEDATGCVAFERGPLVYCFEQPGPAAPSLEGVAVPTQPGDVAERHGQVGPEPTVELVCRARRWGTGPSGQRWPYYETQPWLGTGPDGFEVVAIPYYTWANRGPSQMRAWVPEVAG